MQVFVRVKTKIGQLRNELCRLYVWLGYPEKQNLPFHELKLCWMGHEPGSECGADILSSVFLT